MLLNSFQMSAKQNAEKKYLDVLQKEGLDEEDLIRLIKPKPGKKRKIKNLHQHHHGGGATIRSRHGSGLTHSVLESVHTVTTTQHSGGGMTGDRGGGVRMMRTDSISLGSEYEVSYASEFHQ